VRPGGRPPSTRQVLSFEAAETPLPEEVLLDTSFVVEALLVSQPLHAGAVDVLVRLATEDVRIRFSSMLELELAETAFRSLSRRTIREIGNAFVTMDGHGDAPAAS